MTTSPDFFTPLGWQCPICKKVYSPAVPICYECSAKDVIRNESGTSAADGYSNGVVRSDARSGKSAVYSGEEGGLWGRDDSECVRG